MDARRARDRAQRLGRVPDRRDRGRHPPARAHPRRRRPAARSRWRARSTRSTASSTACCSCCCWWARPAWRSARRSARLVARTALAPDRPLHAPHRGAGGDPDPSQRIEVERRRTSSAGWRAASTRRSTRSSARSRRSASSWPTRATSCARRSRACARTSRRSSTRSGCPPAELRVAARRHRRGARRADRARGGHRGAGARREARRAAWTTSGSTRSSRRVADAGARAGATASTIDVPTEPTVVRGEPERIQRAVSNLVDNALKWSPPRRPVEIDARGRRADRARPRPGLRRRPTSPHVFDRFYRADSARVAAGLGPRPRDRAAGRRGARRRGAGRERAGRRRAAAGVVRADASGHRLEPRAAAARSAG